MKKQNKSSINDLMAKLGASLKESPLKAHERQAENKAGAPDKNLVLSNSLDGQLEVLNKPQPLGQKTAGEGSLPEAQKLKPQTAVIAAEESDATLRLERILNKTAHIPAVEVDKTEVVQKTNSGFSDFTPAEAAAIRRDFEEYKKLFKAPEAQPPVAPVSAPTYGYARMDNQGVRRVGWKTSTVGLYPEDYEKARAVMAYLQQQTGEHTNLSRVVKIALRALEISPKILELNAHIKGKDGRSASRRASV